MVKCNEMQNLFSYGTLQDPKIQLEAIGRVAESHPDVLSGYVKDTVIIKNITYFILVKGEGEVSGSVLKVTAEELDKFDVVETKAYRRVRETLKSGVSAWVYVK